MLAEAAGVAVRAQAENDAGGAGAAAPSTAAAPDEGLEQPHEQPEEEQAEEDAVVDENACDVD